MTWSLNLAGSGGDVDDLREIFEETVRSLRSATDAAVSGTFSGTESAEPFSLSADDVTEGQAVDVDEGGDPDEAPATDEPITETGAEPNP